MKEFQQAETVVVKACRSCSSGLFERDRFCRLCGARQTAAQIRDAIISAASPYATSAFEEAGEPQASFRPVSDPMVKAMIGGMSAGGDATPHSRAWRVMVQMLGSIPIWLMIVLLAPFDAYAAARTISRHNEASGAGCRNQPVGYS
jgi:hypothetical protein